MSLEEMRARLDARGVTYAPGMGASVLAALVLRTNYMDRPATPLARFADAAFGRPKRMREWGGAGGAAEEEEEILLNCPGHAEAAARRVAQSGANAGRAFYACPRPRLEQCAFFVWADDAKFLAAAPNCKCGAAATIRTVGPGKTNSGRRFYSCAKNYRDPGNCRFFKWADEAETTESERAQMQVARERMMSAGAGASVPAERVHGTFHSVEQNTRQWFRMRRGPKGLRVGSSEVGAVVGAALEQRPPRALYDKMVALMDNTWQEDPVGEDEEDPPACAHGHRCEDLIAQMYSHYEKVPLADGGYYEHGEFPDLYGASPDRRVMDPERGEAVGLVEIKAPFERMYKDVKDEHMAQMQYQLWCSGLQWCDYVAVFLDKKKPDKTIPSKTQVLLVRVHRSEEYIAWMAKRVFYFSACLMNRTRPPMELYTNEVYGYEDPPLVKKERREVAVGAWKVREAREQARTLKEWLRTGSGS
jgi:hypothetical protein